MTKFFSMADGSNRQYDGTTNFRVRSLGGGTIRVHISKNIVRDRANYVAIDIAAKDVIEALFDALT